MDKITKKEIEKVQAECSKRVLKSTGICMGQTSQLYKNHY